MSSVKNAFGTFIFEFDTKDQLNHFKDVIQTRINNEKFLSINSAIYIYEQITKQEKSRIIDNFYNSIHGWNYKDIQQCFKGNKLEYTVIFPEPELRPGSFVLPGFF